MTWPKINIKGYLFSQEQKNKQTTPQYSWALLSVSLTLHICNAVLYKTSKARPTVTPYQKDLLGKTLDDILLHMLSILSCQPQTLNTRTEVKRIHTSTHDSRSGLHLISEQQTMGRWHGEPLKINNFLWLYSRELDGDSGLPIIIIYCSIFNNILKI